MNKSKLHVVIIKQQMGIKCESQMNAA